MESFRKSFTNTATKYADYVGMKILAVAEIKEIIPVTFESPLEAAKVLYEEMRTLNQTAEILGIRNLAADSESQPQGKKAMRYKDGRPYFEET